MKTNYVEDIEQDGFAVVQDLLDSKTVDNILEALANARIDGGESHRAGKFFGIRTSSMPFPSLVCWQIALRAGQS